MRVANWVRNVLDINPRRDAVRALSSVRSRLARGENCFRLFRESYEALNRRIATLEREGASQSQLSECVKSVEMLTSFPPDVVNVLELSSKFESNLRNTPENEFFIHRCVACSSRLQKRINVLVADVNSWVTENYKLKDLTARIIRLKHVQVYFAFSNPGVRPSSSFKSQMSQVGQFYEVREDLSSFPYTAASWLKYKKHEWFIVGFELNREITLVWVNKGEDQTSAFLGVPLEAPPDSAQLTLPGIIQYLPRSAAPVIARAAGKGYTSMLMFHNHPNSDPQKYSCSQPSQTDINSASELAKVVNDLGMNLLAFVCERGMPYLFHFSIADAFLRPASRQGSQERSKLQTPFILWKQSQV